MNYTIAGKEVSRQYLIDVYGIPEDAEPVGCHLMATDSDDYIQSCKFHHVLHTFPLFGIGGSTFTKIEQGVLQNKSPYQIFDTEIVNVETLRASGVGTKTSQNIVDELNKYRKSGITLDRIIYSLGIDGCGWGTATEFAKMLSEVEYSFARKTKAVITELDNSRESIQELCEDLESYGIPVHEMQAEEKVSEDAVKYILTGSPKAHGFATKAKFYEAIPNWFEVKSMKEANYLIAGDKNTNSSKAKAAQKNGVAVIDYTEAVEKHNA